MFQSVDLRSAERPIRWAVVVACGLAVACTEPSGDLGDAAVGSEAGDAAAEDAVDESDAARDAGPGADAADAAPPDAEQPQATPDAAADAGEDPADAEMRGRLDAGDADVPEQDAGSEMDAEVVCENSLPPTHTAPSLLSEIGLYADVATKQIADPAWEFSPQFQLWSDGAQKSRWMYLPECEGLIDTRDMDNWSLPVGARAFKEFAVDGKRIETRMVHRYGPGPDDILFAHYLWDEEESEGFLITEETPPSELENPKGTEYSVPAVHMCVRCHGQRGGESGGLPSRYLGFSAIQLSHDGPGQTMHTLSAGRRLTAPKRHGFEVPGTPLERAALGYLHANCGHCHNDTDDGVAFPANPFVLWLRADDASLRDTGAYQTAVGVAPQGYTGDCLSRIQPGDPGLLPGPTEPVRSCVFERASERGTPGQMPPLATQLVHPGGLQVLREWILSLN